MNTAVNLGVLVKGGVFLNWVSYYKSLKTDSVTGGLMLELIM